MQIPKTFHWTKPLGRGDYFRRTLFIWSFVMLAAAGCQREQGFDAMETDAHGYICLKCGGKFYTEQKIFLESKCPQCQQDTLVDAVGYKCGKDQHLTIRPKVSGPDGAAICEKCGTHLKDAMVSPREKDLKAWGATKTSPSIKTTAQNL
jgi:hypothetical protein